jgi:hypothetical protein
MSRGWWPGRCHCRYSALKDPVARNSRTSSIKPIPVMIAETVFPFLALLVLLLLRWAQ